METLATLATPRGIGGIGTILLAGPGASRIVLGVFRRRDGSRLTELLPGRVYLGTVEAGDRTVDEVLVGLGGVGFPEPAEPEIALHAHGGSAPLRGLLDLLGARGARVVDPGAYARAFAPRDIVRGEARDALLRSTTRRGALTLLAQWRGALAEEIHALIGVAQGAGRRGSEGAPRGGIGRRLERLVATAPSGIALHRPPRIVLAGPPNSGKSSLFNALARADRVLVSERPGTTRDAIDALIETEGFPLEVVDTPGIAPFADVIRTRGVAKAWDTVGRASLSVFLVDASRPVSDDDRELVRAFAGRPVVFVASKRDLALRPAVSGDWEVAIDGAVSAVTGEGLPDLLATILRRLALDPNLDPAMPILFTERQRLAANEALAASRVGIDPSPSLARLLGAGEAP